MTTQQLEDLSKDIRKAMNEKRLSTSAKLQIEFGWGDLGFSVLMDGPAAQEIALKHGFGQRYKGGCYHWQI
jgi:hypothetical protein